MVETISSLDSPGAGMAIFDVLIAQQGSMVGASPPP
jgi:hypothetical protein